MTEEEVQAWLANPDFSGNSKLPAPAELSTFISDDNHPVPTRIFFAISLVKNLPPKLRTLTKTMRKKSKPLCEDECEVGAITVKYKDETRKGIHFTSRNVYWIFRQTLIKALSNSKIFDSEPGTIEVVTYLHTHPDLRNPVHRGERTIILPSVDDFEGWVSMRAGLRRKHPNVTFQALVVASGAQTNDTVFTVIDRHLDAYIEAKRSSAF